MRKIALSLAFLFMGVAVLLAQETDEAPKSGPAISFTESSHDFGDIYQGDKVEHIFSFENNGNAPLVLSNVATTCGCTAPSWPRDPIAPGDKAEIKVVFNSAGKMGRQNKIITIYSNAVTPMTRVKITSNVLPKPKDDTRDN